MKDIPESIGFLLVQLMKAHRSRAESALSELGLHVGQEMLLVQLWREDGVPQSQLVEALCVEPPTITKMIQRMERNGLVERRQDEQDARISRVYLTPQGCALRQAVVRVWKELEQQTVQGLTESEQVLLKRLLVQMRSNLT